MELNLRFPAIDQVVIKLIDDEYDNDIEELAFISPLVEADLRDIQWYLETYAAQYTADVDDQRAQRVAEKLPQWGQALFNAVFRDRSAQRLFNRFCACQLMPKNASASTILLCQPFFFDPQPLCPEDA